MDDDRSTLITIGGSEFELVLTTKATKTIGKRYGGLSDLSNKLMSAENFEHAIEEIIWLIVLLANQGIMIHNVRNKDSRRDLLTEEYVELLTSPYELASFKEAILTAMFKGTKRHIESEELKTKNQ